MAEQTTRTGNSEQVVNRYNVIATIAITKGKVVTAAGAIATAGVGLGIAAADAAVGEEISFAVPNESYYQLSEASGAWAVGDQLVSDATGDLIVITPAAGEVILAIAQEIALDTEFKQMLVVPYSVY